MPVIDLSGLHASHPHGYDVSVRVRPLPPPSDRATDSPAGGVTASSRRPPGRLDVVQRAANAERSSPRAGAVGSGDGGAHAEIASGTRDDHTWARSEVAPPAFDPRIPHDPRDWVFRSPGESPVRTAPPTIPSPSVRASELRSRRRSNASDSSDVLWAAVEDLNIDDLPEDAGLSASSAPSQSETHGPPSTAPHLTPHRPRDAVSMPPSTSKRNDPSSTTTVIRSRHPNPKPTPKPLRINSDAPRSPPPSPFPSVPSPRSRTAPTPGPSSSRHPVPPRSYPDPFIGELPLSARSDRMSDRNHHKCWVVFVGIRPGIYYVWEEAEQQILKGYRLQLSKFTNLLWDTEVDLYNPYTLVSTNYSTGRYLTILILMSGKQNAKQRNRAPKDGASRPPGRAPRLPAIQIAFLVRLLPYYLAEVRGSGRTVATRFYNKVNRSFLMYFKNWMPPPQAGQQQAPTESGEPSNPAGCDAHSTTDAPPNPNAAVATVASVSLSASNDIANSSSHTTDPPAADSPPVAAPNATGNKDDTATANVNVVDGESTHTAGSINGPARAGNAANAPSVAPQAPSATEESSPEPTSVDSFPEIDFNADDQVDPKDLWWTKEIWDQSRLLVIAYFQHYGAKVSKGKGATDRGDWEPLLKQLLELVVPAPRRAQIVQFYSGRHWDDRIDAQFRNDWAQRAEKLRAEGKEVPLKPPVDEKLRTACWCWEREDEEFRETLTRQRDEEYEREKAEYECMLRVKQGEGKTYEWSLGEAFQVLQPMAELLSLKFGLVVSIFMGAPLEADGSVRSVVVHEGKTRGALLKTWPEYDLTGVNAARSTFTTFADICFSAKDKEHRRDVMRGKGPLIQSEGEARMEQQNSSGGIPEQDTAQLSGASVDVQTHREQRGESVDREDEAMQLVKETDWERSSLHVASSANQSGKEPESTSAPEPSLLPPHPRPRPRPLPRLSTSLVALTPSSPTASNPTDSVQTGEKTASLDTGVPLSKSLGGTPSPEQNTEDTVPSIPLTSTAPEIPPSDSTSVTTHLVDLEPPAAAASIPTTRSPETITLKPTTSEPNVLPAIPNAPPPPGSNPNACDHTSRPASPGLPAPDYSPSRIPLPPPPTPDSAITDTALPPSVTEPVPTLASLAPPAPTRSQYDTHPIMAWGNIDDQDLQNWWVDGYKYFATATVLGQEFESLTKDLYLFEESQGFKAPSVSLGKANLRHPCISEWFKNRRAWREFNIGPLDKFEKSFWSWWCAIQPSGRAFGDDGKPDRYAESDVDWDSIRCNGKSGLVVAVVMICWWGLKMEETMVQPQYLMGWLKAIQDVQWVLWELIRTAREGAGGRSADNEDRDIARTSAEPSSSTAREGKRITRAREGSAMSSRTAAAGTDARKRTWGDDDASGQQLSACRSKRCIFLHSPSLADIRPRVLHN
ncbi:uncharacterized protein STEHIDRAFT_158053 [Stereum hirsutum FP-91666 SS1]|uniref:uncharacterized protein n=1 Tax=Stereum hirsutum (strain FP-91666) TaxID=721885 RepID=UPI0004449E57|nr:uncharacterized protein STEHIDRAFT_158053 [Stereum hirsutum FP-91666 SS1]EIM85417.1 hypothetical protein STEHIDRAFT_158053 [Stereum hirsutum FP-91666 SS1]